MFDVIHPCLGEPFTAKDSCVIPTLQVCSSGTSQCSSLHHSNLLYPLQTASELLGTGDCDDVADEEVLWRAVGEQYDIAHEPRAHGGVSDGGKD